MRSLKFSKFHAPPQIVGEPTRRLGSALKWKTHTKKEKRETKQAVFALVYWGETNRDTLLAVSAESNPTGIQMIERDFVLAVLELPVEKQLEFIEKHCGNDNQRKARIEQLVRNASEEASFMSKPFQLFMPKIEVGLNPPAFSVGIQIDHYKLMEQIGEGGMGVVYVAEQTEPIRRKVAIKIIKPGMDSKQVIARFEAERQALAMMDHPNIARVIDAGTTAQGLPYFVMELVRGLPITEYCDIAKLPTAERLKLFVSVCNAIQHAHQKGIVHRDIKPNNVMVTMLDGTPAVKVIDFGVAKALHQQLSCNTIYTALHQVIGTPLYMSPEQLELSGLDIDTRTDIYSLGVLLYELLTGQTPFDRDLLLKSGYDELRRIIREQDPPRPSQRITFLDESIKSTAATRRGIDNRTFASSIRGELDWIAMKAIEKDRNRRYESASGLALDVRRFLDDEPVLACPPSTRYKLGKIIRRNRIMLTTAGLIFLAFGVGTAVSIWQAYRAMAAETAAELNLKIAEAERDKANRGLTIAVESIDQMVYTIGKSKLNTVPELQPMRQELFSAALAFCDRLIALDPTNAAAYVQRGSAHDMLLDADKAISDYTKAIELDPKNDDAFYKLSGIFNDGKYRPKNDLKKALEYASKAVDLKPDNPFYRIHKASHLGNLGMVTEANEQLHAVLKMHPFDARASSEAYFSLAGLELRQGENAKAEHHASKSVELYPYRPGYEMLGEALGRLGRFDEALVAHSHSIKINQYNCKCYFRRGRTYYRMARYEEALQDFSEAIKIAPEFSLAYRDRAAVEFQLGHFSAALDEIERFIRMDPKETNDLNANRMEFHKCQDKAIRSRYLSIVDEMVRLNKNSVNSLLDRAIIFASFGDDAKAKSDLNVAITTGTTSYELHHKSALLALHLGEQQLYRKTCENLTVEHSSTKDPEIACWVAWTSAIGRNAVENYAAAISLAKQAVELKPDSRVHLSRLAAILFRSGDFQSARKQQIAAMELPENQKHSIAYDHYFLAMIEHELGQHEQANDSLQKATQQSNQELVDLAYPPSELHKITLELLRREATQILAGTKPE